MTLAAARREAWRPGLPQPSPRDARTRSPYMAELRPACDSAARFGWRFSGLADIGRADPVPVHGAGMLVMREQVVYVSAGGAASQLGSHRQLLGSRSSGSAATTPAPATAVSLRQGW